jgi:hypothetical protein
MLNSFPLWLLARWLCGVHAQKHARYAATDDAKGRQWKDRNFLSVSGIQFTCMRAVTDRLDSVSTGNSKARDLHGAMADPADRARVQKVSRNGLACLVCFRQRSEGVCVCVA